MSQPKEPTCTAVVDGYDIFIVLDGMRIAKRGRPGTPQAKRWVSLEPGYTVRDNADLTELIVEFEGVRLQSRQQPARGVDAINQREE